MREIKTHLEVKNDRQPQVLASEEVTQGGAPDNYKIIYSESEYVHLPFVTLDKPGVSNEALLAIVIDRLEGFQAGKYNCEKNQLALEAARESLKHLLDRTRERASRGVEGTDKI